MKFRKRADRQEGGIYGGAWVSEREEGRVTVLFDRPDTDTILAVEPSVVSLRQRFVRAAAAAVEYQQSGDLGAEPPSLEVTRETLQPLLDFLRCHLRDLRGVEDEVTGEPLRLEDLDAQDTDDLLLALGIAELMELTVAVIQSSGLPDELRERCEEYLRAVICRNRDLPLEQCPAAQDAIAKLEPLTDVYTILERLEQYSTAEGGMDPGAPVWLREVKQIRERIRREYERRRARAKQQAQYAKDQYPELFKR